MPPVFSPDSPEPCPGEGHPPGREQGEERCREAPGRRLFRSRRLLPPLLAAVAVATLFVPVLRFGPVAEDFLFAVDGAWIREQPQLLLAPFQLVWRPGARLPFALAAPFGEPGLDALRAGQWTGGVLLALLGFAALRRLAGLPSWLAAAFAFWWLASPVGNEVLCGESAYLGHIGLVGCVLGVLILWEPSMSRRRLGIIGILTAGAMACGEAWVMLPIALAAIDVLHFRMARQQWLRRAAAWVPGLAMYLAAYWLITSFGYRTLYAFDSWVWLSKLTSSAAILMHFSELSPFPAGDGMTASHLAGALAILLGLALAVVLARTGRSGALALLCGTVLFALPTLSSPEQYGRWLMLPWLGVLGGLGSLLHSAWLGGRPHRLACAGLAMLAMFLSAKDVATTHGDIRDWQRLSQLTRQLVSETPAILSGIRAGDCLMVLRAGDTQPLAQLLRTQQGVRKWFVPRPDDPYGIAPLAAMLTWQAREHRLVFRRVQQVPADGSIQTWRHETGRFVRLANVPWVLVRHPAHPTRGTPGVIMKVEPWSEFHHRGLTD